MIIYRPSKASAIKPRVQCEQAFRAAWEVLMSGGYNPAPFAPWPGVTCRDLESAVRALRAGGSREFARAVAQLLARIIDEPAGPAADSEPDQE